MSERLSLNTSRQAGERMAHLCATGQPWQNHSGSFRGEPVRVGGRVGTGQMPEVDADILRANLRAETVDYVVFSYSTPIAYRASGEWVIPATRYSVTTSKHQGKLWRLRPQRATV